MLFPNNGKVVIIDDNVNDVINLISGLSASKVPFVYYKDELGDDLPDNPLTNVRLVFLDLLLIDDNEPPVKKVISTVIARLKRIISPKNGPYILIYWSTKKRKYSSALEKELNKRVLKHYKPFEILSLSKPSTIEKVKEELNQRFEKFKSLKAFFLLESLVNEAAGNVVNEFSTIFSVDGTWDKNLKDVIYKTGEARTGKDNFKPLSDPDKIKNSLLTISATIGDKMERCINSCNFAEINFDPLVKYDTSPEAKAKFNSKLHLYNSVNSIVKSGCIYFLRNQRQIAQEILASIIQDEKKPISREKAKLFFIDLTPTCDYSQDKKYVRGVYGIMIPNEEINKLKRPSPSYSKAFPDLYIENKIQRLILDFRFISSTLSHDFTKNKWKCTNKISSELLNEFQAEFSKHINRPGYTSIY